MILKNYRIAMIKMQYGIKEIKPSRKSSIIKVQTKSAEILNSILELI
jgi:hypothetical protein